MKIANYQWFSVLVVTNVWLLMQDATARSPAEPSQANAVKLMATIEAERLKLISGVMHANGEDSFEDESKNLRYGGSSKFVLKFDSRLNAFLVDRTCPTHPSTRSRSNRQVGRYVLADFRDKRYFFDSRQNYFDTLSIDKPRKKGMLDHPEEGFLDPRTLGLISCESIFVSSTIEHASDRFLENLGEPSKPDEQGLMKVVNQSEYRKVTTWINTKRGHTIDRYVFEWGTQNDEKTEFNTLLIVSDQSVRWGLTNGVYIPVFYEVRATLPYPRDGVEITKFDVNNYTFRKVHRRYDFEWSQVNEPLDPSVFDYHNFALPAGTSVTDMRAPKVAANGEVHFPEIERLGKRTIEIPQRQWIGKSILFAFAIGLLGGTVALVLRYRFTSKSR